MVSATSRWAPAPKPIAIGGERCIIKLKLAVTAACRALSGLSIDRSVVSSLRTESRESTMRDRCSADGNGSDARLSPRVGSKPCVALTMPRLHTKILSSWSNTTSCAFELRQLAYRSSLSRDVLLVLVMDPLRDNDLMSSKASSMSSSSVKSRWWLFSPPNTSIPSTVYAPCKPSHCVCFRMEIMTPMSTITTNSVINVMINDTSVLPIEALCDPLLWRSSSVGEAPHTEPTELSVVMCQFTRTCSLSDATWVGNWPQSRFESIRKLAVS
mmetsp:Transcript_97790/g.279673  ORF Transcript_97790/g.279673 Transcript_97790/m.279673 type:complete len:270 (+) Transcript_97790:1610-2419(+)